MTTAAAPSLVYDDATHTYRVDGVVVPSVTQVLARAGLTDFSHLPDRVRERALNRGRRVHQAAHFMLEGDLDWATVDEAERGYVESCAGFLKIAELVVLHAEARLYHPGIRVAGTTDALGVWRGERAVVDWCCGDLAESRKDLQTSCYAEAARIERPVIWWDFAHDAPIVRVGVRLRKDGKLPDAEPYRDPRDFRLFAAAAAVVHEQIRTKKTGVGA